MPTLMYLLSIDANPLLGSVSLVYPFLPLPEACYFNYRLIVTLTLDRKKLPYYLLFQECLVYSRPFPYT